MIIYNIKKSLTLVVFWSGVRHSGRGQKTVPLPQFRSQPGVTLPQFRSQPGGYEVLQGQTVTLHCSVTHLGDSTLIWKKDGRMISANEKLIR